MSKQIVTFLLNVLIAGAVILFSLTLSFIFSFLVFKFAISSSEVTSAMVTLFVAGVVISLSVSIKSMYDKEMKVLSYYFLLLKIIMALVSAMMIIRYLNMG